MSELYLVWIEKEVTEFAWQVELLHQLILHHPGGALAHAQPQSVVPDEVTHDLLGRWALCSEQAVCWDVADHLGGVGQEENLRNDGIPLFLTLMFHV